MTHFSIENEGESCFRYDGSSTQEGHYVEEREERISHLKKVIVHITAALVDLCNGAAGA